ncbi:RNA-binding signal recognition particle subunit SEC65 SCDLUD_001287 [Saccharomycodes ludwigii]|uniref:RNA-binding signal recognition particle subunit SEC65 n=1 Tax=Saccharomycodes ludwigii TaxID=36035 RepID=UPI001E8849CA|nr:hypothetical protein SCDLUD_001287 [Saccharomycodes ludwigii]KAH3903642.1 hypothetical protein SCDLUD_001287 [Saccharomycodes ludwigii]
MSLDNYEDIDNMEMSLEEFGSPSTTANPPSSVSNAKKANSAKVKQFSVIYPCYFDKNRSLKQGRRVPLELSIENPLAQSIAEVCLQLRYEILFNPKKQHPQDWGNSGCVLINNIAKKESKKQIFAKIGLKLTQMEPTSLETIKIHHKYAYGNSQGIPEIDAKKLPKTKWSTHDIVPIDSVLTLAGNPMTKDIYTAKDPSAGTVSENPKAIENGLSKNMQKKLKKNKYKLVRR